jgi:hypothetical protein
MRTQREVELGTGADQNGFALMISELIRQNVADRPDKRGPLSRLRGRVAIVIEDVGVSVTLDCRRETILVEDGIVGVPDVTIRASSDHITKMSLVELVPRLGIPDPRGPVAKEIAQAQKDGAIQVFGGLANPLAVLRLTRILSVN